MRVEWSPVVIAGAIKHNNLHCHSPNINITRFANVAGVEWLMLEAYGEHRSQVVSAGAKW